MIKPTLDINCRRPAVHNRTVDTRVRWGRAVASTEIPVHDQHERRRATNSMVQYNK